MRVDLLIMLFNHYIWNSFWFFSKSVIKLTWFIIWLSLTSILRWAFSIMFFASLCSKTRFRLELGLFRCLLCVLLILIGLILAIVIIWIVRKIFRWYVRSFRVFNTTLTIKFLYRFLFLSKLTLIFQTLYWFSRKYIFLPIGCTSSRLFLTKIRFLMLTGLVLTLNFRLFNVFHLSFLYHVLDSFKFIELFYRLTS